MPPGYVNRYVGTKGDVDYIIIVPSERYYKGLAASNAAQQDPRPLLKADGRRTYDREYLARGKQATPKWASRSAITAIYQEMRRLNFGG